MIPLMKNTFLQEEATKAALAAFIGQAGKLSMDRQCFEFEAAFARYQGRKDAVLFNSGGSANLAILQTLKNLGRLKDGDRVGFSSLTWSTNTMPILQMGMRPIALDCDPGTLNTMAKHLEERLSQVGLQAFFATNVLGFAGDLDRIRTLCRERGIILIEDNCESLGTELPQGKAGNFSLASSFSFFVAHHMSTIEGGMACTDDPEVGEMLRIVRANGWDRNLTPEQQAKWRGRHQVKSEFESKYTFYDLGFNLRPTEITGFLGLYQLQFLPENIQVRDRNYRFLEGAVRNNPDLVPQEHGHLTVLSNFAFPVLARTPALRETYIRIFTEAGIEVRPMIAGDIQRQPFYSKYVPERYPLPGTGFIHECGFYCGNYPDLTQEDLDTIAGCLRRRP